MKKLLTLVILLSAFACNPPSGLQRVKIVEIGEEMLKVRKINNKDNVTYFVKKNSLPVKEGEIIQVRNADILHYTVLKQEIKNIND